MIKTFLASLKQRNALLYYSGLLNLFAALLCVGGILFDHTIVLGINAWIKPMKFFLSIAIFCWTMGWYMHLLEKRKKVKTFSWVVVATLLFEMIVICWQAANGRLSHFNVSTPFYAALFSMMGIAISVLVFWTAYIGILFFRQQQWSVPMTYVWGIRIGIILFVIFSFEGFFMAQRLAHTVGAADGGEGLPLFNWSRRYGDLRIAHFFGMHALQLIPLFGYWLAKTKTQVMIFSAGYFAFVAFLLITALSGNPVV